jgi:hypothetical protein
MPEKTPTLPPPPEDPIITAISRLEGKIDLAIKAAQACFDELSVIRQMVEELSRNVIRHEARITLLDGGDRPTSIPPE